MQQQLNFAPLSALATGAPSAPKPRQQRLPKYSRTPESAQAFSRRQITERDLEIIALVLRYHLLPSSLLVRLIGRNRRKTYDHLQKLYHLGLINRFHLPRLGRLPGEFNYYIDSAESLRLLAAHNFASPDSADFESVRRNREKAYADLNNPSKAQAAQTKALFLRHELMISRFHAALELGCQASGGAVELIHFKQGPRLWHSVQVPVFQPADLFAATDVKSTETIPHRPDAFITLRIASRPSESQLSHFYYEADCKTTSSTKFNRKLRGHFHYIVGQRRHQEHYGIARVRAVLIETLDKEWAEYLRQQARDSIVSGSKPSRLFWFTHSSHLIEPVSTSGECSSRSPRHLLQPEVIFAPIWQTPADELRHSLLDA